MRKFIPAVILLFSAVGSAWAAGYLTNGLPQLPLIGTTSNPASYGQLYGNELIPVDTGLPGGQVPQSVAAQVAEVAAAGACMAATTVTAAAGAVTSNTLCGTVTSESLSTAVGANYTLTLTDSLISTTSQVYAGAWLKTATAGKVQVQSIVLSAGSAVIVVKNVGTAAINSNTIVVPFMVYN